MFSINAIARKVRLGEPLPLPWDVLLRAATPITRLSMAHRLRQPEIVVDAHVVSMGNITAGGTGKTPAVIERVKQEIARGHKVAVVTRGYGSARCREPYDALPFLSRAELVRLVGDEPALIRHHAPDVVLIKSAQRFLGARQAIECFGCTIIILDDGYQHVALARDENICLIDASNPFGNGHLIPRGILREPLSALGRATQFMLTRCDQAEDLPALRRHLGKIAPGVPIRETVHAPGRFWNVKTGAYMASLDDTRVRAVCGIGNPEAFVRTLHSLGLDVTETRAYGDHAAIPPEALRRPGIIVTTEKDAMRLVDAPDSVYALEVTLKDWKAE